MNDDIDIENRLARVTPRGAPPELRLKSWPPWQAS